MSEHLRALFVILFIAAGGYLLTRATLARVVGFEQFQRRWGAWTAMTLVLFLSNNQWLYVIGAAGVITFYMRRESNPIALYLMLLLVAPQLYVQVPGFGVVNYLVNLSHDRLLALFVLLPAAMRLRRESRVLALGSTTVDKLLLTYLVYTTALQLRDTTFTDTLRTATYSAVDIALPYFVATRTLNDKAALRTALATLVIAAVPLGFIAVFEAARGWLLYSSVAGALDARSPIGDYLLRDGLLRSSASAGHSLVLGYYFVIAIGAALFISGFLNSTGQRLRMAVPLVIGLLASLARAPWLAAAALFLLDGALSARGASAVIGRVALVGGLALAVVLSPAGDRVIDLLPWVGTVDSFNVEYRERLLDAGLAVIKRSPWTGSTTYLKEPEMVALIQGQGIIDVVNSYLGFALAYGLIGLTLFIAMFALGLKRGFDTLRNPQLQGEWRALGTALTATTLIVLLMIYTLSSIATVPIFYWLLLAMLCALPGRQSLTLAAPQAQSISGTGWPVPRRP